MRKLFLIPFPAVVIGALAMYRNDISIMIWGQNIFGLLIAVLLSYFILKKPRIINSIPAISISIVLLILTFLGSGAAGIHRWVSIGPVRFYVASIVIPILIVGLWRSCIDPNRWNPNIVALGVSLLLALQPDASQTTAFIVPMAVILFHNANKNYIRYSILSMSSLVIILTWVYLDNLPPVAYVEDILKMVAEMGIVWLVLGVISLVILPLPFFLYQPRNDKLLSISLGTYFTIVLISTLFGNFPVPLMGYGISPIFGYFFAIAWLVNAKAEHNLLPPTSVKF